MSKSWAVPNLTQASTFKDLFQMRKEAGLTGGIIKKDGIKKPLFNNLFKRD